jgi:multiple sugar transport system ATP-binding protein
MMRGSRQERQRDSQRLDFRSPLPDILRMARVALEHLAKFFKGPRGQTIRAADDVCLTVEDKELVVLVGPSGCGKTTTLRLIAGLEEAAQGTVSIDNDVVNDVAPKDRDVAMVFQNLALYPHMSAYENMAFGLKLRKYPRAEIEKRVKEAAEMLALTDCLERKPKDLSGGQRQRVAVGRAIVRQPKVFLFDEPLSNLDAQLRAQMRAEISRLHRRLGATMIYVTHDQSEAMTLADRIAVMKEGKIQQVAEPMALYQEPANMFVASFIGSPPMNFFNGCLVQNGGAFFFEGRTRNGALAPNCLRVALDGQMAARVSSYAGKQVVLGIRPENIVDQRRHTDAAPDRMVEAVTEAVMPMGSETLLQLATAGHSFVARVPPDDRVTVNQNVSLVFEMNGAQFFDPDTQARIA